MNISQKAKGGDFGKPVLATERIEEDFRGYLKPVTQEPALGLRRRVKPKKKGLGSLWTDIRDKYITPTATQLVSNVSSDVLTQAAQTPQGQQVIAAATAAAKQSLWQKYQKPILIGGAITLVGTTFLVARALSKK